MSELQIKNRSERDLGSDTRSKQCAWHACTHSDNEVAGQLV